jgi:hypothetical protein
MEVFTAVLLKVLGLPDPEDESTMAVRNVSNRDGLAIQKILFFRLFTGPKVDVRSSLRRFM